MFVLPQDKNSTDISNAGSLEIQVLSRDVGLINSFPSLLSLLSWLTLIWHLLTVFCNGRIPCISTLHTFLPMSFLFVKRLLLDFHFSSLLIPAVYLWANVEFQAHSASDFHVYLPIKRHRCGQCVLVGSFSNHHVDLSWESSPLMNLHVSSWTAWKQQ